MTSPLILVLLYGRFSQRQCLPAPIPSSRRRRRRAYEPAFHILMLSVPIGEQRSNVAGGSLRPAPTQPGPGLSTSQTASRTTPR